jgi:hypothetical protein
LKNIIGFAALLFAATASFAGVSISLPKSGAVTNSPMHVVATATPNNLSAPVKTMQVYVDGALSYQATGSAIDTYLSVSQGTHMVAVKAWDTAGANFLSQVSAVASGSGVFVTSPRANATITGDTRVQATAYSPGGITAMHVYDNGTLLKQIQGGNLDATFSLAQGSHYLVVQAWDTRGTVFVFPVQTTVATTTTPSTPPPPAVSDGTPASVPSTAIAKRDIDQMTGWEHCDVCAGIGGNGPQTPYSMTQFVASPSLDGKSATFWLGGTTPYSNALWWKQLGGNDSVNHFVYDLYFFIKDPSVAQALEFDVNHSVGNLKYIYGTECNIRNSAVGWRVWDTKNAKWNTSGASCTVIPNSWNRLTWEFERVGTQTHFIAVTMNGNRQVVNKYYYAQPSGVHEVNVAFQMDGNSNQDDYQVWLDKVSLFYW